MKNGLIVAFIILVTIISALLPSRLYAWEGDDGGLDQWEVTVGRYADRINNQMQLTEPPKPPPTTTTFPSYIWPWDDLAECESGGDWQINTGNGFYGGLQFTLQSWRGVGGTGYPHQHSRREQIYRGELLQDIQGWGAWPACSRKVGLR